MTAAPATPVIYRRMQPEDGEAVFNLRMRAWGTPNVEYVRRNAYSDPLYSKHIFGAFAPDGSVLSTVGYWLRSIRDAGGIPRRVGCVASVVTIEEARWQGHTRALMQMALDAILARSAGFRNPAHVTSVPSSTRMVASASAERSDHASHMPRSASPGRRKSKWSVTHTESTPNASAPRAKSRS